MTQEIKRKLKKLYFNEICECENELDKLNEDISVVKNQETEYVRQKAINQVQNYISFLNQLIDKLNETDIEEEEILIGETDKYELETEGIITEDI